MKAMFVIVEGRATRKEVRLPLPAKVGRSRDSDLTVVHPTVSRSHCELFEDGGTVMVRDTGSSNGTFVEGNRVSTAQLKPGDKLTIGPLTFQLVVEPADNGASPPEVDTQDTTPVAGPMVDTAEIAREPAVAEELDLEALPEVGKETGELETISLTDGADAEGADQIELPEFEDSASPEEESLDFEPLSLSTDAEAELELPDVEEKRQPRPASEQPSQLESLDVDEMPFELAEESAEPLGKTAESAEGPASLDPLQADDEAALDLLAEFDDADETAADKPPGDSTGGELTDEDLDKFLNELD